MQKDSQKIRTERLLIKEEEILDRCLQAVVLLFIFLSMI